MVPVQRRWKPLRVGVGLGLTLVLAGSALTAPARAETPPVTAAAVDPCPTPMPVSAVRAGMTGDGLTVVRGSTPQAFGVEVLGVVPDGLSAGRDLILVEAFDVNGGHVIDQGGGIWAGMSGSPVYVGGQLLGAIAYGFTLAPSPIAGVTPAENMTSLLDPPGAVKAAAKAPAKVALPKSLQRAIAAKTDAAPPTSLRQLPVPVAVSGLSSRRLDEFQRDANASRLSLRAHAGAGRPAPRAAEALAQPEPGGNFVAAFSYGDLTASAVGTTTAVCGNQALAFGHPWTGQGPVSYGANVGESLAVVRDNTFGSFKWANVGAPIGTVDQDRSIGIRATLGSLPPAVKVTTTIRNSGTGGKRTGTTSVVAPELLPEIATYAALVNFGTVFDEIGDGRATSHWTITGTRANGKTFTVKRSNRWASRTDISAAPAYDLGYALDSLQNTVTEPVRITGVSLDSTVNTGFRQLRITKVAAAVNKGRFGSPELLRVRAGDTIRVQVTMTAFRSTATTTALASLKVPANARGKVGAITVGGGVSLTSSGGEDDEEDLGCLIDEEACDDGSEESLSAVIKGLQTAPQNDDVVITLALGSEESDSLDSVQKVTRRQGQTVTGFDGLEVAVR